MALRRFYVDLSPLGRGNTGVALYSIALAQRLEQEFQCEVLAPPYLCGLFRRPIECPAPPTIKGITIFRNFWSRAWRRVVLDPDTLVYAPHMNGFAFHERQIITIHDLIHHFHRTRNLVANAYNAIVLPRVVKRVRAVLTVSATVRAELCQFYGLPPERVQVVPNGIDLARWQPAADQGGVAGEPYLLTVSANRPYKNTLELLDMHDLWASKYSLKIVSSKARYGAAIRERVAALGLTSRVQFLDDLPEDQLIALYRGCAALVYVSQMEGFGRPALEAMAVGRPAILSDIPVHLESFAAAGIFITPGRPETWTRAFAMLGDAAEGERRRLAGLQLAQEFSWARSGDRLVETLLRIEPELRGMRR